jgi:hypothetical protein
MISGTNSHIVQLCRNEAIQTYKLGCVETQATALPTVSTALKVRNFITTC